METDFVSGNMSKADCVTPPGVFGLTYKTRNAILRGANYETPVNYWMPFNGNIGMHDATWRRAFGGTNLSDIRFSRLYQSAFYTWQHLSMSMYPPASR